MMTATLEPMSVPGLNTKVICISQHSGLALCSSETAIEAPCMILRPPTNLHPIIIPAYSYYYPENIMLSRKHQKGQISRGARYLQFFACAPCFEVSAA